MVLMVLQRRLDSLMVTSEAGFSFGRPADRRPPVQGRSSERFRSSGKMSLLMYLGPVGGLGSEIFGGICVKHLGAVGRFGSEVFGRIFAKYFGASCGWAWQRNLQWMFR